MSNIPAIKTQIERECVEGIVVCSYNTLLPNHSNWWVFKYYHPKDREDFSPWEYRKKKLQQQFDQIDADLISLQEANPETFASDFDFLLQHYEGVCHQRSNIACAAFWKKERFKPLAVRQRDRSIITVLQDQNNRIIAFAACHLNAGQQPKRRFQQVFAICQQFQKEAARYKIDLFVIAGDFNAVEERTAVQKLLVHGVVEQDFREEQYPEVALTSKTKEQSIGTFEDVYSTIGFFPTMEVLNARERILDWEAQELQEAYVQALTAIFHQFAGSEKMSPEAVEAWAMRINQGLRGSEYRKGMALAEEGKLDLPAFLELHKEEALLGKSWSLYSDLRAFGVELPQIGAQSNQLVLDRIWLHSKNYQCTQARHPILPKEKSLIEQGDYAPNSWHPSDHFPLVIYLSPTLKIED